MESDNTDTDNIDWALPDFPVSQSPGISAKISRELPQTVHGASLALLTRFVHTLVTRNVPELLFQLSSPRQSMYLGEGATYRVVKGRFEAHQVQEPGPGPKIDAAFKTAKVRIPQGFANLQPTIEEYQRLKSVLFEVEILSHPAMQNHPNIVSILGHSWFGLVGNAVVPAIALELAELGNARAFLARGTGDSSRRATEEIKTRLCGDVAAGLEFLHACKITHGDVKLDNVLIFEAEHSGTFIAKISDFERSPQNSHTRSYTGTTCYNAPESQEARRSQSSAPIDPKHLWLCDVFSYGLFVLEAFVDATFYGSLQGGEKLLNQVLLGSNLGGNDILPLALEIADRELRLCPQLLKICRAVCESTLPNRPSDRLRDGWAAIRRLLRYQNESGILPVNVFQSFNQDRQSPHSVLEIFSLHRVMRVSSDMGDGRMGPGIWSQLEEVATTSPSFEEKGRAAFGLFLCANIDFGYAPRHIDSLQKALESLTVSAEAGYPAAFAIGRRIFEANNLEVPDVFRQGPQDDALRRTLERLAQLPNSDYYSAAVRAFWPPALRDAARGLLPTLPEINDLFAMPTWVDDQSRVMGGEYFKGYAEENFLLHRAIISSSRETCERLMMLGCDVNAKMPGGITPLGLACRCAEVDIIQLLLGGDADASLPDDNNTLPLHWLALLPGGDITDCILTRLADSCNRSGRPLDTTSHAFFDDLGLVTGGDALSWAIQCRNHDLVRALLCKGFIDPVVGSRIAKSNLRVAAATLCVRAVECLLKYIKQHEGSDFEKLHVMRDLFPSFGSSPVDCSSDVHRWIMHGRTLGTANRDFIDTLERFGGRMDYADTLKFASVGNLPLMRELVRRGVNTNIPINDLRVTPLSLAIFTAQSYKGYDCIRYLLSLGAQTYANGETPIGLACNRFDVSPELLSLICAARPDDVDVYDAQGFTPLLTLTGRGEGLAAVKVLVQAGANVRCEGRIVEDQDDLDGRPRAGETALAYAIGAFNWEIAEYLLEKGASLEYGVACGRRQTVLHLLVNETFIGVANNRTGYMEKALFLASKLLTHDRGRDLANEPNYQDITPCDLAMVLGLPLLLEAFIRIAPRGVGAVALELGPIICDQTTSIGKVPRMFQVDGEDIVLSFGDVQGRVSFVDYKKRLESVKVVCERATASLLA
ncbi:hypothetical protein B0T24DRAFT_683946 [Lasiosphaeria ovina]|uniref:Protein kinase domain-containing protein n=1 Tax=Lasiosphaeria ovina TaxID=92902 RepID=A0AAE0JVX8_9PEZI|nr:hypothetical protein B0T24DRAFT_683946 [Lasiosphaeria ovina]